MNEFVESVNDVTLISLASGTGGRRCHLCTGTGTIPVPMNKRTPVAQRGPSFTNYISVVVLIRGPW